VSVQRIEIARYPALRALAACLAQLTPPTDFDEVGDWRADIDGGPPALDHSAPCSRRHARMAIPIAVALPADVTHGANYYPPGGAGLGWHTDSNAPGWRIYIGRPLAGVPGELLTVGGSYPDEPGTALAFCVPRKGHFWHAVRAPGERLSLGIRTLGAPLGTLADLLARL
jgi:hypothetical protein